MKALEWARLSPDYQQKIEQFHGAAPVRIGSIADALGLKIKAATMPPGVSGEIRPSASGYIIRVNRHDSPARQRFTVAHEVAHFLLHREFIGSGISDDALYRSNLSDQKEAEANRLAAELLMPRQLLSVEAQKRSGLPPDEKVRALAEDFGVSEIAMSIRLGMR